MERDDFVDPTERREREPGASSGDPASGVSGPSDHPLERRESPLDVGSMPSRSVFDPLAGMPGNSEGNRGPFGAASISLLLNLLIERTRAQTWSVERQRAHARALLHLSREYWFSDEESAVLCAFLT
ncbi:MAG: hypothetical protein RL591_773 [Planctomycetota bacterium]|jgi:hypothetical protein